MRLRTLCIASILLTASAAQSADRLLVMEVEKPKASFVTETDFDAMAGSAGTVARTKDATSDVSCGLRFMRSGDIIENQTLPKEITSHAELDAISDLPVDVFVMDQLSVCGDYINVPAVAGCERRGPILVEAGSRAHLTLIHEAGHKSQLRHTTPRAQCEDDPDLTLAPIAKKNNIMFCRRHEARKWLTTADCNTLKATPHYSAGSADLEGPVEGDANIEEMQLPGINPTQELLSNLFGESIDFAAIAALSEAQLDAIRAELSGEDHRFWEQAAYVLGIRGTPEDLQAIVALAHRAANILTPEGYRARSAVPEAIGMYLAYHEDTPDVDWLKTFLLSNVASGNARTLGNGDDEVQLLANRYAQGAALAGDIDLAQGALDILAAEQVDPQLQEMVASRALASQVSLPEEVIAGIVPVTPNAMEILRERAVNQQIDINPGLVDVLRDEGLTLNSTVIQRFNRQEFGPGTIDFQILDQRVQDLMLQQPINRQQGP